MFLFRPLPLIAALAFATNTIAAETRQPTSACEQAMRDDGAQRQQEDADLDGSGACRLADGRVRKASRENTGTGTAEGWGRDDAEPGRNRFADEADEHALRMGRRVVTIDMTESEQRAAVGFGPVRSATDLFSEAADYVPLPALDHAVPGVRRQASAADGAFAFLPAVDTDAARLPGATEGALTSREGGRSFDATDATLPAPVPEPSTWAMLLAGLGALTLLRRR